MRGLGLLHGHIVNYVPIAPIRPYTPCEKGFQVSEGVIEQLKDVPPSAESAPSDSCIVHCSVCDISYYKRQYSPLAKVRRKANEEP